MLNLLVQAESSSGRTWRSATSNCTNNHLSPLDGHFIGITNVSLFLFCQLGQYCCFCSVGVSTNTMVAPMSHGIPSALTSPGRLQKIDQLREKNVGKHLPLPQLVVVGDQSSGKSSLLETLTGIPFPRGQELCTRYATQISHRRDDLESINISIIPGPQATPAEKSRLEEYRKSVRSTTDLHVQFEAILDEVSALPRDPGSPTNPPATHRSTFTWVSKRVKTRRAIKLSVKTY